MRRLLSLFHQRGPGLCRVVPVLLTVWLVPATVGQGTVLAAPTTSTSGQRLWASQYDGLGDGSDYATDLDASPDGAKIFVTGSSDGTDSSHDYATIAHDAASGAVSWTSRYNGPGNSFDTASGVEASPDGFLVFVTGSAVGDVFSDYATIAYYAATGEEVWVSRYNGPGDAWDDANALGLSPDGSTVFVTGTSHGGDIPYTDYATVAYDPTFGSERWISRYNGAGNNIDSANALGVSSDGSTVFVTGYSYGAGFNAGYATIAYDAVTGEELWVSRYDGVGNGFDIALDLEVSPDGSMLFVTGHSVGVDSSQDYATVAYEAATGSEVWVSRYNGPRNRPDYGYALAVSPDGSGVFVTGKSHGLNDDDYATVAYDSATGAELWVSRYNGPGNSFDAAYDLGVSPDGRTLFVTGKAAGATHDDYTTVAYDAATGANLWRRMDGRRGSDYPTSLSVSPDGSAVFVTGSIQSTLGGKSNYGTVAFAS